MSNNMQRNAPFEFFVSFLVDLNKFESLRNLTIFIILFISSSEIINNVEF